MDNSKDANIAINKIAIVSCGGTIAMTYSREGSLIPGLSGDQLIARAPRLSEMGASIDVIELFNKDSTNIGPAEWSILIDEMARLQLLYDGLIVVHGTDTMAHTATAVSLALGRGLRVPIVFTGAQLPIESVRTDAVVNLESAMEIVVSAVAQKVREVMVVFSHRVLRASRTIKISESRFDAFDSPGFPHLADLTAADKIVFNSSVVVGEEISFDSPPVNVFDKGVLVIDADSTTSSEVVLRASLSSGCTGLILRSVGSGNLPSEGANTFLPVIEKTLAARKPVILTSRFVGGKMTPDKYQPGRAAIEMGAGHSGDMTDVAAKIKLMWLIGQGITNPESINEAMLTSIVGEIGR